VKEAMVSRASLKDRLRYAFDNSLSGGAAPLIGWLAVASAILVLVAAVVIWLSQLLPRDSFISLTWMLLLHTLGKDIPQGDSAGWVYRLFMLAVTYGGVFITGTLIAVLTTIVRNKVDSLREGRSKVIEEGHTAILGWAPHIFSIIRELVIAKASEKHASIVILGDKDKVEMETEIHAKVAQPGHTRIVCRRGSSIEIGDLDIVGLNTARSIIIPAPEGDDPDSAVIKTLLAITNSAHRRSEPYHIVAEIRNPKNMSVARIVGRDEVELVLAGDLISRIAAQTCREPGLSAVYTELLNFEGDEIYFREEPELVGRTFGQALLAYETSTPIGLQPKGQRPRLKPPLDAVIQAGDEIIAIAEDDDAIYLSRRQDLGIRTEATRCCSYTEPIPERTLLLGWNWCAPSIINELDRYVAPGSTVTVVADAPSAEEQIRLHCSNLQHESVTYRTGNTTDRHELDQLAIETYNHVIILCYCDTLDRQEADARTLVTLLHLRDIAERCGHQFSIVSEMVDIRNRNLAEVTRADDFIVSEQLVSLVLAQISQRKELNAVFADLFDPEGSEIHLRPVANYIEPGQRANFYTVVESARQQDEIALGYHLQAHANDATRNHGVVLNPNKHDAVTFSPGDRIIVLAEA
jgi:voltage-gated potassium channel Kch